MASPINATTTSVTTSVVYYASGQQAAANPVAGVLGLGASSVQALTSSAPVPSTGTDVVVVLGTESGGASSDDDDNGVTTG